MEKLTSITGKVIPLEMKDVDTDLIIPAQYLTSISRDGYAKHLFTRLKESDPHFVFNLKQYQDAAILVADENFGCGSSREHAVWALQGAGIKVIIAPSFADIFFSNSAKNGLLLITQPEAVIQTFFTQAKKADFILTIDLAAQTLKSDVQYFFEIDPFLKHCLINGLDELDYLLSQKQAIIKFRQQQIKFD